jgi:MFS family permease
MGVGLTLQAIGLAWLGLVSSTTVEYTTLVLPFIISGFGMGLFFAPMANVTLSAVRPQEEGQASGASNAIRELGGVFGVAVLAAVFARSGSYQSPQAFVDGMVPAVLIGAVFVAVGAVAAFAIPRRLGASERGPKPTAEALGATKALEKISAVAVMED